MTKHSCGLCRFLYAKRPPCQEWRVGWLGNYILPFALAATVYWVLWRFGP